MLWVDARMVFEAGVFGGDEGVDDVLRDLGVIGIDTVARVAVVAPHFLAVGGVEHCGKFVVGVFQLFDGWHVAYPAVVDEQKEENHAGETYGEDAPHPADYKFVAAFAAGGVSIFGSHFDWSEVKMTAFYAPFAKCKFTNLAAKYIYCFG